LAPPFSFPFDDLATCRASGNRHFAVAQTPQKRLFLPDQVTVAFALPPEL
jgi:hypothetical protein